MTVIKNLVLAILSVIFFAAVMYWMIVQVTDVPDVIFSYSSKECVRVDYPDGTHGDCSRLPKRFNHVWGQ